MSISIEKSEKFQKEYKSFQNKIEEIENLKVKSELENLLSMLLAEVKLIDKAHVDLYSKNYLNDGIQEQRNKVAGIRQKIARKLEDYNKTIT